MMREKAKQDPQRVLDANNPIDPRVLAAAKALHKWVNPRSRWERSEKKDRWLVDAQVAIDAADAIDPLRNPQL